MNDRTHFVCTGCGTSVPRWLGRCPGCDEWNTMVEERLASTAPGGGERGAVLGFGVRRTGSAVAVKPITQITADLGAHRSTGIGELDRVLGGGFVPGSATLLSGEPGIGKSTLVLQVMSALATEGITSLLATAEESAEQVHLRAGRLAALHDRMGVLADTELPAILDAASEQKPGLLVIDSIQTIYDPALESAPGSVAQVREGAAQLVRFAKSTGVPVVMVGHVTKEGSVAGPRVLEHVVDTVLTFEGDAHHSLRMVRASKNRFGSTGEVGMFEMTDRGLAAVADPSSLFLADRKAGMSGSAVAVVMEGSRPVIVEIQALVSTTGGGAASRSHPPRRSVAGLDFNRVTLMCGLVGRKPKGATIAGCDIYAQAVGGARIDDPAADLAIALALASSVADNAIHPLVVAIGEVGLGTEVRRVTHMRRRLDEAARLGFAAAITPETVDDCDRPPGLKLLRVADLASACEAARINPPGSAGPTGRPARPRGSTRPGPRLVPD